MPRTTENRLRMYATYAAVPTAGLAAGTALAGGSDFFHYGGPAIEVIRNDSDTSEFSQSIVYRSGGVFFGTPYGGEATDDDDTKAFGLFNTAERRADLEGNHLGGDRKAKIGGPFVAFGMERIEDEGVLIGGEMSFNSGFAILSSSTEYMTEHGDFQRDQIGSWQTDYEEVRGFLAFADDGEDPDAFGWIDVGWDGDTLTIYDFAVNYEGNIETGQTSASSAVPGAGGLAALAMGAAGMRRRRKRSA